MCPKQDAHARSNLKATWFIACATVVNVGVAVLQWNALRETNAATDKAFSLTQRAFVFVKGIHYAKIVSPFVGGHLENFVNGAVESSVGTAWRIEVSWENSGNTAAEDLIVENHCQLTAAAKSEPFSLKKGVDSYFDVKSESTTEAILGPKQTQNIGGCAATPTDIMTTEWGGTRIFVFGKATYRDETNPNCQRVTEYCLELANITGNVHEGDPQAAGLGFAPI